jgi:hypothetical protein
VLDEGRRRATAEECVSAAMSPPPHDEIATGREVLASPGHTTVANRPKDTCYRNLPPLVGQSLTDSCWAAATQSWLEITRVDINTEAALVNDYATNKATGAITEASLDAMRSFYNIDREWIYTGPASKGGPARSRWVTYAYLAEKLCTYGHLLLIFRTSTASTVWHTHVAYGVGYPNGKDPMISIMDPNHNVNGVPTGIHRNHDLPHYRRLSPDMMVAWKRP